ncbi:hypothetical protein H0W32_01705 [Patescibacteria group bacterium]|nr:hypothetical protein [Patescibacteria group bacterium]
MHHQKTWSIFKISLAIALLVGASFGYTVFIDQSHRASAADISDGDVVKKDLMALLDKIESISLDGSIFADRAFTSLQDFSVTLVPETPGRANPFAPLSSASPTRAR